MSRLSLVFAALLVSSMARGGVHRNLQGQWVMTEDDPQYEEGDFLPDDDRTWPESTPEAVDVPKSTPEAVVPVTPEAVVPVTLEDQNSLTTADPHATTGQAGGEGLAVWIIVLVAVVLVVSVVAALSVTYYMCIWRGGRIHYQPQKVDYS